MKEFTDCEKVTRNPIIRLKEKRSTIIFENPQRLAVRKLRVDKCSMIKGLRCDYALEADSIEDEFYIELKGSDINHAVKQIESTIQQISDDVFKKPKSCFIIATRVYGSDLQRMVKEMKKKYNSRLKIVTIKHIHILEPSPIPQS
jgi:hypothetical protein